MGKLTATKIRNLGEPGRYPDGDGLFLELRSAGKGSWFLHTQVAGKRRDISLGALKNISLADARDAAYETRRKLAQGIDPVAERKKARLLVPTFKEAAKLVHEEHKAGGRTGSIRTNGSPRWKLMLFLFLGTASSVKLTRRRSAMRWRPFG